MSNQFKLDIGCGRYIYPGMTIRIGRFSEIFWIVNFGWFTFAGNRPICGWFLVNKNDSTDVRPIQLTDLNDIYLIEC